MDGSEKRPYVVTGQIIRQTSLQRKIRDHNEAGSFEGVEQSPVRRA